MRGGEAVGTLRQLALAAGADDLAREAAMIAERLEEQRFNVACVGQFKRGKSTLVNALVGLPILPTGVLPVTSLPTILRFGPLGARVHTRGGWIPIPPQDLGEFVTEEGNPANTKDIQAVEVLVPAAVLQEGLCLVDTPGIGSVFEANSAATREFLPQIDAALVVLGADPPISGEELHLVERLAAQVDALLFVVNKVDRVTETERDQATEFLRRTLAARLHRVDERVYQVSAAGSGGGRDWEALAQQLQWLARNHRGTLVARACQRGVSRLGRALACWIGERRDGLLRPVEASARRAQELSRLNDRLGRALFELNPLFAAEEQRLSAEFYERAERFRQQAESAGLRTLRAAWVEGRFDNAPRAESLEFANRVARDLVYPWLEVAEREAEAEYQAVAHRFSTLARDQLMALAVAAEVEPGRLGTAPAEVEAFRITRQFRFSDRMSFHYPRSPWPGLMDALLPAWLRRRRRQRRAEVYLLDLLRVNSSRVAGDLAERV